MVGSHSLSTCRVKFAAWGRGFVVVGLNSSPLGWVEFAAVGLGWIRCGWVGYSPWFSLAVVGLYSPGWAGFVAIGFGWVSLTVVGLDWPRWVGFVAVGLDLPLLGFIRRCWALTRHRLVTFALTALNSR